MTNLLTLPEVTITMVNPRGDTWGEGLQYFYSDGLTEIGLDGITFTFDLYTSYAEGALSLLHFSTADFAAISSPTSTTNSVLSWLVPSYFMAKLKNAPSSLDFRCVATADTRTFTAMVGTLSLT